MAAVSSYSMFLYQYSSSVCSDLDAGMVVEVRVAVLSATL